MSNENTSSDSHKTATCPATWDLIEQLVQLECTKNRLHLEYMGKAMPADVYLRFQNLRDERIPALSSQLRLGLASAPDQPPAHFAHAYADQLMLRCLVPVEPAPQTTSAAVAPVLDSDWRFRMLDGAAIERDEMGCGEHPALPTLEEGMKPKQFFDALGIELRCVMAEDQMDMDAYEAMVEVPDYNAWTPGAPDGEGWKQVAIFDTEDGPACWWIREAPPYAPLRVARATPAIPATENSSAGDLAGALLR